MTSRVRVLPERIESDDASIQRDLFRLVLTIVELIRQLIERQAVRRMDDLSGVQVEELGTALLKLEAAMADLRATFDLTPEDLNIDLGPLGSLLD
jgi:hypothetical protein